MALYVPIPAASPFSYKRGPNLSDTDQTVTPGTDKLGLYVMPSGTMTANRSITLSNAGAVSGQVVDIVREGTEAFTLTILSAAAATLLVIPANTSERFEAFFNGAWVMSIWYYI